MLGRTAHDLYWMFRQLERAENTARLVEAGLRISLTRSSDTSGEWSSVIESAGATKAYLDKHEIFGKAEVVDFLLRDYSNPASVRSAIASARNTARQVRTALTREVWEATNDCWYRLTDALVGSVTDYALPEVLAVIRQESAAVRGALHGTMLRNDIYNFARLGTFIERADNTARILDVKYYVLLPSTLDVGSPLDNAQWESILRSLSAQRAYHWKNGGSASAASIASFILLDPQLPRSLAYCFERLDRNLQDLADAYGDRPVSVDKANALYSALSRTTIDDVFSYGLHDFLRGCIDETNALAQQIELDYRFTN